jgi:HEPN domain-containing protein/predicted nucleotidyltransferase
VVHDLRVNYQPEKIILFGSVARGQAHEFSDIDLILVKDTDKEFVQRSIEASAGISLEAREQIATDLLVYTPRELAAMIEKSNPFIEHALNDCKVLYESPGSADRSAIPPLPLSLDLENTAVRNPEERGRRWLAQAEHNLSMARTLLENGFWAGACFQSEQAAELALKALLYSRGHRYVTTHSVQELVQTSGQDDAELQRFQGYGEFLDRFYLPTRYPDALDGPGVPFEAFNEPEALQALGYAAEVVDTVRARMRPQ